MRLLIDIGNTRSKFSICDDGMLSPTSFIETSNITITWLLKTFKTFDKCIVSNVNHPQLNETIEKWCRLQGIDYVKLESEKARFGLLSGYRNFKQLGIDRWLAMLGALTLHPNQANLVIDSGTATTIDLVLPQGQHVGGWILPGIHTLTSSVVKRTENVVADSKYINNISFSDNTCDAVNKASWAATVGFIQESLSLANSEYLAEGEHVNIILTGGNAKHLMTLLTIKAELVEELIFLGMQRY